MIRIKLQNDMVKASIYPTNRIMAKRVRDSSGRIPSCDGYNTMNFINLSLFYFICNFGGKI